MKILIVLLALFLLNSCVHRSVSPDHRFKVSVIGESDFNTSTQKPSGTSGEFAKAYTLKDRIMLLSFDKIPVSCNFDPRKWSTKQYSLEWTCYDVSKTKESVTYYSGEVGCYDSISKPVLRQEFNIKRDEEHFTIIIECR